MPNLGNLGKRKEIDPKHDFVVSLVKKEISFVDLAGKYYDLQKEKEKVEMKLAEIKTLLT